MVMVVAAFSRRQNTGQKLEVVLGTALYQSSSNWIPLDPAWHDSAVFMNQIRCPTSTHLVVACNDSSCHVKCNNGIP